MSSDTRWSGGRISCAGQSAESDARAAGRSRRGRRTELESASQVWGACGIARFLSFEPNRANLALSTRSAKDGEIERQIDEGVSSVEDRDVDRARIGAARKEVVVP